MQRIGVFVCWCGSNIAGTVDVVKVAEALKNEPGVVLSTNYQYMCSQAGQEMIKEAVKEHKLTGIVVCSCSPRMHEATFRKTAAAAGINPYMVEIANIREQCSWIHKDMEEGTEKAIEIYEEYLVLISRIEESSVKFVEAVAIYNACETADDKYAALVECYYYAQYAEISFEGVEEAMAQYTSVYENYISYTDAVNADVAISGNAVGSVRTNCGITVIIAIIVKKIFGV